MRKLVALYTLAVLFNCTHALAEDVPAKPDPNDVVG